MKRTARDGVFRTEVATAARALRLRLRCLAACAVVLVAPELSAAVGSRSAPASMQSPGATAAQRLELRGTVVDEATGAPILMASLRVDGGSERIATGGSFRLELAASSRLLRVSAPGYADARIVLVSVGDEIVVRLRRLAVAERIEVVATAVDETDTDAVLDTDAVWSVAGGLDNVFRALQTLPGVATPDDYGSRLSIRGGGPDQNVTLLDGIEVHNPYRLFGLVSAFDPATVDRFELTAGGFGARYGDRLSSLLRVETRAGRGAAAGGVSLSLTDTSAHFEGALPGRGNTFLLSGRRTYYDLVAERLSDNDFPAFGDLQGRFDLALGGGA